MQKTKITQPQTKFTSQQHMLLNLLSEVGCVSIEQIRVLFNFDNPGILNSSLNYLKANRCIRIEDEKYVLAHTNSESHRKYIGIMQALWVIIRMLQNSEGKIAIDEIETISNSRPKDTLYAIKDNSLFLEASYFSTADITNARLFQAYVRSAYNTESFEQVRIIMAVPHKEMMEFMENCKFPFEHILAVTGNFNPKEIPEIEFFQK